MKIGRVVIVGLGLIGGSIAKALRAQASPIFIGGIDRDAQALAKAQSLLDQSALPDTPEALSLLQSADLVILAIPARATRQAVAPILDALKRDAVLTDTASVKLSISREAATHPRASRFVPAHPMAGREVGGFDASSAELFRGAAWFVVEALADADALDRVRSLTIELGAVFRPVDAEEHDRSMALVSHLPQLAASALADLVIDARALDFAGPGFRDTTRIAGGPDAIWADIFADNRRFVAQALADFLRKLEQVAEGLSRGESEGVSAALELLKSARDLRDGGAGDGDLD